jgi:cell division protein FtsX
VRLLALALLAAALSGAALAAALWPRLESDEVRVLDLLGADPAALRRPAVYAGALILLVAAALACWLVSALDAWLTPDLQELAQQYALAWPPNPLPPWSIALACAAAALAGGFIGSVSARLALARARAP